MPRVDVEQDAVCVDARAQAVVVGGRRIALQHKPWRVLAALLEAAPSCVTRETLIDDIWAGNAATGEKALNHALWTIRAALGDDARAPKWIRTIPRTGYQWIGPPLAPESRIRSSAIRRWPPPAIAAAAVAALVVPAAWLNAGRFLSDSDHSKFAGANASVLTASTGSRAFFGGRDLIVEHFEGCRFVFKPKGRLAFSQPVFSEDGGQIAFRVERPDGCRLVVYEMETRKRLDFDACPSDGATLDGRSLT